MRVASELVDKHSDNAPDEGQTFRGSGTSCQQVQRDGRIAWRGEDLVTPYPVETTVTPSGDEIAGAPCRDDPRMRATR